MKNLFRAISPNKFYPYFNYLAPPINDGVTESIR